MIDRARDKNIFSGRNIMSLLCVLAFALMTFAACVYDQYSEYSIKRMDKPSDIPVLIKALDDRNKYIRWEAAFALGKIGPDAKEAVPALIKALDDRFDLVRSIAAFALAEIGPDAKEAVPALVRALGDKDTRVRSSVAFALRKIGPDAKEAVPALVRALGDRDIDVSAGAAVALVKIGSQANQAIAVMIKSLDDKDPEVQREAAHALADIGPDAKEAVPALIKALDNRDRLVRLWAIWALGGIGPTAESIAPALIILLSDSEPIVREKAISVLQQIGYKGNDFFDILELLASNDPDKSVKKIASDILRNIKLGALASGKPIEPQPTSTLKSQAALEKKHDHSSIKAGCSSVGKRFAVIIGISNYKDSRIPSLRYASSDAKAFYDWIISPNGGKYAPSQVKLLLSRRASGSNIKEALFEWLNQALEEDLITIYFAGHGSPDSPESLDNLFLLPYDVQYDKVATTGFPMWDIETALKRFIKAKKVVVIADACHAAGVGQSFDTARRADRSIKVNPISSGFQSLSKFGEGVCVLSASDDKQYSQESKKWGGGHGVFTYFLLKGLKGEADYNKDSSVTLGELIPYLSEHVRTETRNAQSPTVAGKFDPALSIGK